MLKYFLSPAKLSGPFALLPTDGDRPPAPSLRHPLVTGLLGGQLHTHMVIRLRLASCK